MRFMKSDTDTLLKIIETKYRYIKNRKRKFYICKCECGNVKEIRADSVIDLSIRSCGCYTRFIKSIKYNDSNSIYDVQNILYYNNKLFTPIFNYNGYYVSLEGEIYSKRDNKIMKQATSKKGYLRVSIFNNLNESKTYASHRIVANTYILNKDGLETVNHKNFNRKDNRASNLEWMSIAENNSHKEEAMMKEQRDHKGRKLNAEKVRHIRTSNLSDEKLAGLYGVTTRYVGQIKRKERWKNL